MYSICLWVSRIFDVNFVEKGNKFIVGVFLIKIWDCGGNVGNYFLGNIVLVLDFMFWFGIIFNVFFVLKSYIRIICSVVWDLNFFFFYFGVYLFFSDIWDFLVFLFCG